MKKLAILMLLGLAACGERASSQIELDWEGSQVARVCRDGTKIYLLKNGEYRTGWNRRIVDISTICQ
jgi:hypothetical protein